MKKLKVIPLTKKSEITIKNQKVAKPMKNESNLKRDIFNIINESSEAIPISKAFEKLANEIKEKLGLEAYNTFMRHFNLCCDSREEILCIYEWTELIYQ